MRKTFAKTLLEEAKRDKDIFLITGELGFGALEEFWQAFPGRFLNIGVAEQNMISFAAGLATTGKKVYVYSIVPFATMRPFEQIRNDLCYQNLNVKIVAVGAGFSYSFYGASHYGLEDFGAMRVLPNMVVTAPGDPVEVREVVRASVDHEGPMYIRLAKAGEPVIHESGIKHFKLGKAVEIFPGNDATIIATSNMLESARDAGVELNKQGISCRLLSMPTIKPIDAAAVISAAETTGVIVTVEEHNIIGGLGSAVAEVLAEHSSAVQFKRLGVPDMYPKNLGSQKYLRDKVGISTTQIVTQVKRMLA